MSDVEIRVIRHPDTPGRTRSHSWTAVGAGPKSENVSGHVALDGTVHATALGKKGEGVDKRPAKTLADQVRRAVEKVDAEFAAWEADAPRRADATRERLTARVAELEEKAAKHREPDAPMFTPADLQELDRARAWLARDANRRGEG